MTAKPSLRARTGCGRQHRMAMSVSGRLEYSAVSTPISPTVIVADRWYPSSRTCSCSGSVAAGLDLSQRVCRGAFRGLEIDRDLNAAGNLERLAASAAATACGGERSGASCARTPRARTGRVKRSPVKQEPDSRLAGAEAPLAGFAQVPESGLGTRRGRSASCSVDRVGGDANGRYHKIL